MVKQDPSGLARVVFLPFLDSNEYLAYFPVGVLCGLECYSMELTREHHDTLKELQMLPPIEKDIRSSIFFFANRKVQG